MFNLFSKSSSAKTPAADFSALGADMHSHLLPGIDDGAKDMEESLSLIRSMQNMGFSALFTTPHVMSGLYPNSRDRILFKRDEVLEAMLLEGIHIRFDAAAEYFMDEGFEGLYKKEPLLTLPGGYVLVEMSTFQPHPVLHQTIFDLQMKGYKPVLAHPERYGYYSLEQLQEIEGMGCVLQINFLSLIGYYGKAIKNKAQSIAHKIQPANMFWGSDLHHSRHAEQLLKGLQEQKFQTVTKDTSLNSRLCN